MPILFLTVVIDLIGFGILMPILPFLAPAYGGNDFDIAMMIAVYSICAGICGPFWGKLSDRFGRKPILLICLAGTAASYVLLAMSTSLLMLYLSRILCGLMAGNFGVASAMIADMTTDENRAKGMGLIGAAFGIGLVLGPFLGGTLSGDDMDFVMPALAAACLSLLAMFAGLFILKESLTAEKREQLAKEQPPQKQSLLGMLKSTGNTLLVSQYFVHNTCVSIVGFLFPLMARDYLDWGPKEVGMVFGAQGILIAILQSSAIGPLSKKIGELQCLLLGVILMIVGFFLFAFIADDALSIVTAVLITITGAAFNAPILNSLTSKRTPQHQRGRMMGTTASISAWGRVCAPLTGGAILSLAGFTFAWFSGAVFATLLLSWVARELSQPVDRKIPE